MIGRFGKFRGDSMCRKTIMNAITELEEEYNKAKNDEKFYK